ncbi:hypothetical protein EOW77_0031290 [Bradyrhizobium yuanmingense]|nr:hypothetical protein EOW77_0031290 [Bradyrhizobium yuanmingense]
MRGAQRRSNPDCLRGKILDCFAALAMTSLGQARPTISTVVARMERSAIRGGLAVRKNPDFAALHPGYGILNTHAPWPAARCGSSRRRTAPRRRGRAS